MSAGVENVLGSTAVWSDEFCRLKDFPKRHALPAIALIHKGSYRGIGQNQGQGQQVIYIHDVKTGQKVLAEGIKQKVLSEGVKQNGRKGSGIKYSLPITYGGWFEVLSEDGKPIQPFQGVEELSKAAPEQCLVREAFKAPVSGPSSEDLSTERLRQLNVGERLTLRGEVEVAFQGSRGGVAKKRYLRCSDDRGEYVYLPFDLRAQFSPIAGLNNIAGVHSVNGLLDKFRLPIFVRLVHGVIPARVQRNFSPVFRLLSTYTDDTAFILPLPVKDSKMVTISTREPLILAPARNWEAVRKSSEFDDCRALCDSSIKSYLNSVHILVESPEAVAIPRGKKWQKNETATKTGPCVDEEERLLFEEIEDIYRYVREGGDPPLPRTRPVSALMPLTDQSDVLRDSTDSVSTQKTEMEVQEAVLNLSEIASSRNQFLPAVRVHESPEDDGYWEEPIYEDIAKIRERKMAERASVAPRNEDDLANLPVVNKATERRHENELTAEAKPGATMELGVKPETEAKFGTKMEPGLRSDGQIKPGTKAEPGLEIEPVDNPLEPGSKTPGMVENLRQLFLPSLSTRLASPLKRKSTVETTTGMLELAATETPPIPTKSFEDTTRLDLASTIYGSQNVGECRNTTGDAPKPDRTLSVHTPTMDDNPAGSKSTPPKVLPKNPPTVQTSRNARGLSEKASKPPARNCSVNADSISQLPASQSPTRNSPFSTAGCVSPKSVAMNPVSTPNVTKTEPVSLLHASKEPISTANGASPEPPVNLVSPNHHLPEKRVLTPEEPKQEAVSLEQKPTNPVSVEPQLANQLKPEKPFSTPKIQKSEAVLLARMPRNLVSAASKLENNVSAEDAGPQNLAEARSVLHNQTVQQNQNAMNMVLMNEVPMNAGPTNAVPVNQVPVNAVPTNAVPMKVPMNAVPMNAVPTNVVPTNVVPTSAVPMNQVQINPVPFNPVPMNTVPLKVPMNAVSMSASPTNAVPTNVVPMNQVQMNAVPMNTVPAIQFSPNPKAVNPISMHPFSANPALVSANTLTAPTTPDSSRSVTADPLPSRRSESPPRQIIITTSSSRINCVSGSAIQVVPDANAGLTTTAVNGVTTIKVIAPRLDPRTSLQGYQPSPGNTLVHVRLPNSSIGHAIYRPQGATTGLRIQSGTVYLTNSRGVENDHWA